MCRQAVAYGIGAAGLGLTGLVFGDFALQWQPVPQGVPARTALAYASALFLIGSAMLILTRTFAILGAYALTLLYGVWVAALHAPRVMVAPLNIAHWLGFAEILALAIAAAILVLAFGRHNRPVVQRVAQSVFGACPIVFGLSHFAYPDFTASMVPGWIPVPLFWAYTTGMAHIAAGAGIATGVLARPAAILLAAMCGLFALLVHLPRVADDPGSHVEWTMLFVATSLAGSAWIISAALTQKPVNATKPERPT